MNPFAPYIVANVPPTPTFLSADLLVQFPPPGATSLAADGISAVVLEYQSGSDKPVTFTLTAGAGVGSLSAYDPNYLQSPNPTTGVSSLPFNLGPSSGPDEGGTYTFLALLWGPSKMPQPGVFPSVNLTVTASQEGQTLSPEASVTLMPPPLLLIHGVWSSADQAWPAPPSRLSAMASAAISAPVGLRRRLWLFSKSRSTIR